MQGNFSFLSLSTGAVLKRRRRSLNHGDSELAPSAVTIIDRFGDNRVTVHFKRSCQRQTTISCAEVRPDDPRRNELDFRVVCARVKCRLPKLAKADTVHVKFTGWLWAPSFFKHHLPDVKIVSRLSLSDWGVPPLMLSAYPSAILMYPEKLPAYEMPQTVVFRGVTGRYLDRIHLWPILVGVVLGSILLFSLIASLYCCGFCRRRQKTKEAKRRSMMAASRRARSAAAPVPESHPSAFLLQGKPNGAESPINGKDVQAYTANPMHAGSPDLIYASDPQPPTPPVPNELGDESTDWLLTEPDQSGSGAQDESGEADQSGDGAHDESAETAQSEMEERLGEREASPASSAGLPEWLMSELKANEEKSSKSKSKSTK